AYHAVPIGRKKLQEISEILDARTKANTDVSGCAGQLDIKRYLESGKKFWVFLHPKQNDAAGSYRGNSDYMGTLLAGQVYWMNWEPAKKTYTCYGYQEANKRFERHGDYPKGHHSRGHLKDDEISMWGVALKFDKSGVLEDLKGNEVGFIFFK
ncbi:MAG: hypothetical protein AAF570_00930, partial [Bacteroidota bacterium]